MNFIKRILFNRYLIKFSWIDSDDEEVDDVTIVYALSNNKALKKVERFVIDSGGTHFLLTTINKL